MRSSILAALIVFSLTAMTPKERVRGLTGVYACDGASRTFSRASLLRHEPAAANSVLSCARRLIIMMIR